MLTNGNGHLNGNGHKPHYINDLSKKQQKAVQEAAVKADGSPTKMAKILGVSKSGAAHHLKKPELKQLVLDEREKALKKVGISRVRVYGKINKNLDSFIPQLQTHAIDRSLELLGDKKDLAEGEGGSKIIVNMPVVVINGNPLSFKVGSNGHH